MKKALLVMGLVILAIVIYAFTIILAPAPSLDKALSRLKAQGIPTTLEELIPNELPDTQNGAVIYKEALKIFENFEQRYRIGDKDSEKFKDDWNYFKYYTSYSKAPDDKKKEIAHIIMDDPSLIMMYGLLDKASRMECQFHKRADYKKGLFMGMDYLFPVKKCADLLAIKAGIEYEAKDYDNSLESALLVLRMANSFKNEPSIICQLVREGIWIEGVESLQNQSLALASKTEKLPDIIKFLQTIDNKRGVYTGLKGEAVIMSQTLIYIKSTSTNNPFKGPVSSLFTEILSGERLQIELYSRLNPRKFLNEQMLYYYDEMAKIAPLFELPYYKGYAKINKVEREFMNIPLKKAFLAQILFPGISQYYIRGEEVSAYTDIAVLGIANRLYKSKHKDFVDSLDQLVPDILPSLPKDPFSGKDYVYKRDGTGFVIYSLGKNMKDDYGKFEGFYPNSNYDITWREPSN